MSFRELELDSKQAWFSGLIFKKINKDTPPTAWVAPLGVDSSGNVVTIEIQTPTVVQTTGTSTDDVMSQDITTKELEKRLKSDITWEPNGAMSIENMVMINESDFLAGTPIPTTLYLVMTW